MRPASPRHWLAPALLALCWSNAAAQTPPGFTHLATALRWRSIGPERGGRSLAAAGSEARPAEYFFGATGGGLWKTTDGGTTWRAVTDGQVDGTTVGALAVAPSNPDVVYIGFGEAQLRSNIRPGAGIAKSSDGGRTWARSGLDSVQSISRIRVDPKDPNRVYAAALGSPWGPSDARGVYRSRDGGRTWERVLFRDRLTGGADLLIDPHNSARLLASLWQVRMTPGGGLRSGGPGSGLFLSDDGGDSWTEITKRPGMPTGTIGKIGVAISGPAPGRWYALVDTERGGLFASDDQGGTWALVNQEGGLRQRPTYFNRVAGDPADPNVVYVLNLFLHRSADGGRAFTVVPTPHPDHHDLWIDPGNPRRMISASDGGASITINAGDTWTEQRYPTAQFYRVATTADLPYHVCGAQQDANTICVPSDRTASRSINPIVGRAEFVEPVYPAGGGESGSIAPDPRDPNVLFATGPQGLISRLDRRLGLSQARDHQVAPTWDATATRERFPWTIPLVFSPRDPAALYVGSQHLWRSRTEGREWTRLSPDLTRSSVSGGGQGAISVIAPSPHDTAVVWIGTDDGMVQRTQDGGATWRSLAPPSVPDSASVSGLEVSPHRPGIIFVALTRYQVDDPTPYLFRTDDDGASWQSIASGFGPGEIIHVIREDPLRPNLLYAGTERGVRLSFDGGAHWERLSSGLPTTPVVDLVVKRNDLAIATHGRSFYILDDIHPLRTLASGPIASLDLFAPDTVYRRLEDPSLQYLLQEPVDTVTIEIVDSSGGLVRRLGPKGGEPGGTSGIHRLSWDLRGEPPATFPGMILWVGQALGPLVPPGRYQAKVAAGPHRVEQWFVVARDRRATGASDTDVQAQYALAKEIGETVGQIHQTVQALRDLRGAMAQRLGAAPPSALARAAEPVRNDLDAIEAELYQVKLRSELDAVTYPIKLNNRLTNLQMSVETGDGRPTAQAYAAFESLRKEWRQQNRRVALLETEALARLNRALAQTRRDPIVWTRPIP